MPFTQLRDFHLRSQAGKVRFDACQDRRGATLAELGDEPFSGFSVALALIATIYTTTKRDHVTRDSARAIGITQRYPVVSIRCVEQSIHRPFADRAASTEIIKSMLPLFGREVIWQSPLARVASLHGRNGNMASCSIPIPIVLPSLLRMLSCICFAELHKPCFVFLKETSLLFPGFCRVLGIASASFCLFCCSFFIIFCRLFRMSLFVFLNGFARCLWIIFSPSFPYHSALFGISFAPRAILAVSRQPIFARGYSLKKFECGRELIAAFSTPLESVSCGSQVSAWTLRSAFLASWLESIRRTRPAMKVVGSQGEPLFAFGTLLCFNAFRHVFDLFMAIFVRFHSFILPNFYPKNGVISLTVGGA